MYLYTPRLSHSQFEQDVEVPRARYQFGGYDILAVFKK